MKIKLNLIVKIVIGIIVGILLGLMSPMPVIKVLSSLGFILSQYIKFVIPLLVIAFVAKGVADFGKDAGRGLIIALLLAYTSTVCAELLGFTVGRAVLDNMGLASKKLVEAVKVTPYLKMEIPPIMHIMSALVLAIVLGLGITWIKKREISVLLDQFSEIISILIRRGLIPVFPFFVATVFMEITAKGQLITTAKAFFQVLVIIIPTQLLWLLILYSIAGLYTKKNPFTVFKTMLPAYFTACGTMSSAATLPVVLECVNKVPYIKKETANFCVPLFNIAHLPGAAMAITMSAMTVSLLTKGHLPSLVEFLPFIFLLGFIEVAAVGVPGGSVTAALGILETVLGFDQTGLGLMLALFMIQDSFGTATNVTGDGALTMIMNKALGNDPPLEGKEAQA